MNVTLPTHVSIISDHGIEFPLSQESELKKALREIHSIHSRRIVLHHGCSTKADEIARRFALSAGWRIEGHPAYSAAGIVPRQTAVIRDQLEVLHPARRDDDRNTQLILASDVIVAVTVESDWSRTSALLSQATDAGRQVTYIEAGKLRAIPAQGQPWAPMSLPAHSWLVDACR